MTILRQIAVLGATGSIGRSTLDIISQHPDRFRANVLTAQHNVTGLASLCAIHHPSLAIIADPKLEARLAHRLASLGVRCNTTSGMEAIASAAGGPLCDTVVVAVVGAAGLVSSIEAARAGKRLLLANKESIVMAGTLLLEALNQGGGKLIPVDSEHNAIFQCLPGNYTGEAGNGVQHLILTASGGPFYGRCQSELTTITPEQACKHPTWSMGRKISVDSATLMNKGLEVIEAHHLFSAAPDAIEVLVHPQSLVHALVNYVDGSMLAQLGHPDMRTALAQALAWPERVTSGVPPLDLSAIGSLHFEKPDLNTFRCLSLAYQALRAGGDAGAILNAANEVAVALFLAGTLPFLAIANVVESVLIELSSETLVDIPTLIERDHMARAAAKQIASKTCW